MDTTHSHDQIRHLSERWQAAMVAANIPVLLSMVTEDVVFSGAGAPPLRGRAHVEAMYRMFFPQFASIAQEPVIEEIEVAGDWAFVWGQETLRLRPTSGGAEIVMTGCGLSVVRRGADGECRFARAVNNLAPQTPASSGAAG